MKWIKSVLDSTPFINSFFYFPISVWKYTSFKFGVLWVLSSSPILWQFIRTDSPTIKSLFTSDVLFVYTSAFIAPIIWSAVELLRSASHNDQDNIMKSFKSFRGSHWWFFGGLLVLVVTAITYGQEPKNFVFTENFGYWVYGFALLLWIITLANDTHSSNFGDYMKSEENEFLKLAEERGE